MEWRIKTIKLSSNTKTENEEMRQAGNKKMTGCGKMKIEDLF
jgi:hypothetical protein